MSSETQREGRILFLDLETTGLDPHRHQILEVGAILVNADLGAYGGRNDRFHELLVPPPTVRMLDTIDMHRASGLLHDVSVQPTVSSEIAEERLLDWLVNDHEIAARSLEIAGFSIHFDRSFIRLHMPRLHAWLSHRMIDVSTLRSLHRRWVGEPRQQKQAHRALADCEEAITELRTYRDLVWAHVVPTAPASTDAPKGDTTP